MLLPHAGDDVLASSASTCGCLLHVKVGQTRKLEVLPPAIDHAVPTIANLGVHCGAAT